MLKPLPRRFNAYGLYLLTGLLNRLLMLFFGQPEQKRFQREVDFETGLSLQTVQRELANLVELEILKRDSSKSRVYYSLDHQGPWTKSLQTIVTTRGQEKRRYA